MSLYLYRKRYENKEKNYFLDLYEKYGGIPADHMEVIKLRMNFFTKYVLDKHASDYHTNTEKDWAYVARKEYWYDVNVRAVADSFIMGDILCNCVKILILNHSLTFFCIMRMFMLKKFVFWPFFPVFTAVYFYRTRELFMLHNKKFFDMCNVGEQYELGYTRNVILRECNRILDREDF